MNKQGKIKRSFATDSAKKRRQFCNQTFSSYLSKCPFCGRKASG